MTYHKRKRHTADSPAGYWPYQSFDRTYQCISFMGRKTLSSCSQCLICDVADLLEVSGSQGHEIDWNCYFANSPIVNPPSGILTTPAILIRAKPLHFWRQLEVPTNNWVDPKTGDPIPQLHAYCSTLETWWSWPWYTIKFGSVSHHFRTISMGFPIFVYGFPLNFQ